MIPMIFAVISFLIKILEAALYVTHPNPANKNKIKIQKGILLNIHGV